MNSKHPKIWKTEDEIISAIDRAHRYAKARLEQANEMENELQAKVGRLEKLRFEWMAEKHPKKRESLEARIASMELSVGECKEDLGKIAKSYHRTIEKTLPRLGEVLAAFRTETFKEVLGEYKAVAVK